MIAARNTRVGRTLSGPPNAGPDKARPTAAIYAAIVAVLLIAATSAVNTQPALKRLDGIPELKTWFNAAKGHPRLIFLLSPT
jgi:hypothetical protein